MNSIKNGAIISYGAIIVNIVIGLIYTPWMIKEIGVSDYGIYSLILVFLSYFMLDFGLGSAVARFISSARARGDVGMVNILFATISKIYLILNLCICSCLIVAFFLLSNIFADFTALELSKFKTAYCIAGFFSLLNFPFMPLNGVFIAYEKFVFLKSCDMIQKFIIVFLMFFMIILGYGLFALVFINGAVAFVISLVKLKILCNLSIVKFNIRLFDKRLAIQLFKFSSWTFIIGIAQRLLLNMAPTIIGSFSGTSQIAIFSIAMTLEAYAWTFASALNGLFMSKVARISIADQTRDVLNQLMIKVGRVQLLIIGIIISGIIALGKPFIILWMGHEFTSSYYIAVLLISPGVVTFTQEIANTLLYVENEVRFRAILFILASIVSVILSYYLVPIYGAIGAAISIMVTLLSCHIIGMNIIYSKVLKLDIRRFFKDCHARMLPIMLFVICASFIIQHFMNIETWFDFFVHGCFFTVLFYLLMWKFFMNSSEKQIVYNIMHKILNIK